MLSRLKQLYRNYQVAREIATLGGLPRVWDVPTFLGAYSSDRLGLSESRTLDIGCGTKPRNPFKAKELHGIDIRENLTANIRHADLTVDSIPYPNEYFDYVSAHDFLEHVPRILYCPKRRFPFVELMNEIWRVLKPHGMFFSFTPVYPFSPVFRDPTHVNIISYETFSMYFDEKIRGARMYGFTGNFKILQEGVRPPHLLSVLQKLPA